MNTGSTMPATIISESIDVSDRLNQLGWTHEQLSEVVGAMVSARNDTTENDPSSAPGWMAWKDGTRRLREIGLPMGWQRDETNNVPSVVNAERGLRVVVCNTDDGTCIEDRIPQNRTKKGPATDYSVTNNQGWLFSISDTPQVVPISGEAKQVGISSTYYLCVYHQGNEVRTELSCPVAVTSGYFSDFVERIFLNTSHNEYERIRIALDSSVDDDRPEFDIPVTRKQ